LFARDGARITVRVPEREIPAAIGHLLRELRVADLAIEDPPLEEIMRVMFGKAKQDRAPAEAEAKAPAGAGG
jgi:ABC-type uncharacterized transport system ATPase subunit